MGNKFLRRTWAEVNLEVLGENYKKMRAHLEPGIKFLGVVKANAYGHGAVRIAQCLQDAGCRSFAVSCIREALELPHWTRPKNCAKQEFNFRF